MTPDEYQTMNDILIAQSSENEILIEGLQARVRDLEAEKICLNEYLAEHYPDQYWQDGNTADAVIAVFELLKAGNADLRERLRLCEATNIYFAKQMNWGTP